MPGWALCYANGAAEGTVPTNSPLSPLGERGWGGGGRLVWSLSAGEFMKHRQHRTNRRERTLQERARDLRQRLTPAEQSLWTELRGRRFAGFKFRRQYTYGPFILDFFCVDAGLAVEVDGETHVGRELRDQQRAAWLEGRGLKVVRFYNHDLYDEKEVVLEAIYRECERRRGVGASGFTPSPPTPLPQGGEGRRSRV